MFSDVNFKLEAIAAEEEGAPARMFAMLRYDKSVTPATCGVATTLGSFHMGSAGSRGSCTPSKQQ